MDLHSPSDVIALHHTLRTAVADALRNPLVIERPNLLIAVLLRQVADRYVDAAHVAGEFPDPRKRQAFADEAAAILKAEIARAFADADCASSGAIQ